MHTSKQEIVVTSASTSAELAHVDGDRAFYILEGEIELEVDGERSVATPGTSIYVTRGAAHRLRALTATARVLVIGSAATPPR